MEEEWRLSADWRKTRKEDGQKEGKTAMYQKRYERKEHNQGRERTEESVQQLQKRE